MENTETNIIKFQKPVKNVDENQRNIKDSIFYDSMFTPELHKELLEKARQDYEQ